MKSIRQFNELRLQMWEPYRWFRGFSEYCFVCGCKTRHLVYRFRFPLVLAAVSLCVLLSACGGGPDNREESSMSSGNVVEIEQTGDETTGNELNSVDGDIRTVVREADGSLLYHYAYPEEDAVWLDVRFSTDGCREIRYYNGASTLFSPDGIVTMQNLGGVRAVIAPPEDSLGNKKPGLVVTFPDMVEVRKFSQGILETAYPDGALSTVRLPNVTGESARVRASVTRFLFAGDEASTVVIPVKSSPVGLTVQADGDYQFSTEENPQLYIGFMDGTWLQIQRNGHIDTTFADGSQFRMQGTQRINMEFRDGTQILGSQEPENADQFITIVNFPEIPKLAEDHTSIQYSSAGGIYLDGTVTKLDEVPSQFQITYPDGTIRIIREVNGQMEYQVEGGAWRSITPETPQPTLPAEPVATSNGTDSNSPDAEKSFQSSSGTKIRILGLPLGCIVTIFLLISAAITIRVELALRKIRIKMQEQTKQIEKIQDEEQSTEKRIEAEKKVKKNGDGETGLQSEKMTTSEQKPDDKTDISHKKTANLLDRFHNAFYLEVADLEKLKRKQYQDPDIRLQRTQRWGRLVAEIGHQGGKTVQAIPTLDFDGSDNRVGIISNQDLYYSEVQSCFQIGGHVSSGKRFRVRVTQVAELELRDGYYQLVPGKTGHLFVEETLD